MTKIQEYWFGYVLEKVNTRYEVLEEIKTPRITVNIFGNPIIVTDYHRIAWLRFTPGIALSQAYKTKDQCETYQKEYTQCLNLSL